MNEFVHPVQITPEAHLIQSFWKHPLMPAGAQMNSMVLTSSQPVVFDTGVSADERRWLTAVSSVVEPADVRWIVLTHDDHDHVGNLDAAIDGVPPRHRRGLVVDHRTPQRLGRDRSGPDAVGGVGRNPRHR